MSTVGQFRVLTLKKGEKLDTTVFRLEKGWTLHFVLGPSLSDKKVRVFTNHPLESQSGSNRNKYRELIWQNLSSSVSDVYDSFAECRMVLSGSFNYFFTIDGSANRDEPNGSGYFLVDPYLLSGNYDEKVPLDCITCQTVLSKCLGPFDEWEARLRVAKETGYNMIHFTPIQELGLSNSAYCLKDQMRLNPVFNRKGKEYTFDDVQNLVKFMKDEWEVLSITDLVYNHTANESAWVINHPECAYNLVNSPHLKPAYLLDRILWHLSLDAADGKWTHRGLKAEVHNEDEVNAIRSILTDTLLPKYAIEEYYLVSVEEMMKKFQIHIADTEKETDKSLEKKILEIIPDPKWRRFGASVDLDIARCHFYGTKPVDTNEALANFQNKIEELNAIKKQEIQEHLAVAVDNFIANVRWRFIDYAGPQCSAISEKDPLMFNYFTLPPPGLSLVEQEEAMDHDEAAFCMAHNGWVMNDDPLRNFAEPGSFVYLRRELLPWGDSVKLRYGSKPEDCPFLWETMKEYTVNTAKIFHGVRLDNCHSTPIHVAEYMLDEARKVRPELYVIAELFTSNEAMDNTFINRLGLNSLIRESMTAWDSHELGRLVHRFGGFPVGSFIQPPARPLVPCVAHAIFFDQTHDNPSPVDKRTAYDLLPTAALVAMASCASGSNRGYDELVPHHIHVVEEDRLYQKWAYNNSPGPGKIDINTGIISAKKALNILHYELGHAGFNQVYVDQMSKDVVAVTRHNPVSHQSVIMVAWTVFSSDQDMTSTCVKPLEIEGHIDEIIMEGKLIKEEGGQPYVQDMDYINGLSGFKLELREHIKLYESEMVELGEDVEGQKFYIEFTKFTPGSIFAVKVSLGGPAKNGVLAVRKNLSQFGYRMKTYSGRNLREISGTELEDLICKLTFNDLNRVLYRCEPEEKDDGVELSSYHIPGYGTLPYCGLQGVVSVLDKIRLNNDLGHPLCANLRAGNWLPNYIAARLIAYSGTHEIGKWLDAAFAPLEHVPAYLRPSYFDAVVTGVHMLIEEVAWAKMSSFVRTGSSFTRELAMGSLQFCATIKCSPLPELSPHLAPPRPPFFIEEGTENKIQSCVTLAAGLPHFSVGLFRCWGRDTFISLRGLLLLTGRFVEARFIILAFAGSLRHGLIPNLLGSGIAARYNARDAVWWWLQCIQEYCKLVPNGHSILKDVVTRMYPEDDSPVHPAGMSEQLLQDTMQEALQKHASSLRFRERHAGECDKDMVDEGFNNAIGVNWTTGFVYGGNIHNAGTWMDKNGSSEKAGNKGKPATPRDGSAVELVGLCASTVKWLAELHEKGVYPHDGVKMLDTNAKIKFIDWYEKIKKNFEKYFWINTKAVPVNEPHPDLINRRGIYKDSYNASQPWADFQLRPNFPIAMVVAPDLFTPAFAWIALEKAHEILLGPLGMKTLDPSDWKYNGDYINSDDSDNPDVAHGYNYHQGPEWLWPIGFFLRAKLKFARILEQQQEGILEKTINSIKSILSYHHVHLQQNEYKSLPELTNSNGSFCHDSCDAQAWSVACVFEVLAEIEEISSGKIDLQIKAK